VEGYDETTYGRRWSPFYDEVYEADDVIVDLLARHAGDPPRALELAIGSGRIALPLAAAGVEVSGIDASEEMVSLLRAKDGGEAIPVLIEDFAEVGGVGELPLIYLAFNSLFALLSQARQVECFRNVARRLEPGGRFIIDCFVPDLSRFDRLNTRTAISAITSVDEHWVELTIHDPVRQHVDTHIVKRAEGTETVILPVEMRYAWPSELDLMAQLAGLELEDRFGWYDLRPFTERSTNHMSIYRRPG